MSANKASGSAPCSHTGIQCLVTIARHHGYDLSVNRLVHDHALGSEPDADYLAAIAEASGLKAWSVTLKWREFSVLHDAFPVIAILRNGNAVIVREVGPNGTVVVLDPLAGQARLLNLTREKFEAAWDGDILLVKRASPKETPEQRFGLRWFIPELLSQKAAVIDVVAAASMLHVLALAIPIFFQIVIDKVLVHEGFSTLTVLATGILVAISFEAVLGFLRSFLLLHATTRVDIRIAVKTFGHLLSLTPSFFENSAAGVLSKHMQQAERVREFLTGRLLMTLLDASVLVVFLPVLAFYSVTLTLVVLASSAAMALTIGLLILPYQRRLRRLYQAEGERQALLVETIHGMGTVKALALEPLRRQSWDRIAANAVTQHFEVGKITVTARAASAMLEKLMSVAVVWIGALAVFDHVMTVGELVAFQMLAGRVSGPLVQLVALVHEYQETLLSVRMLGEVMNAPPERNSAGGLKPDLTGRLEFSEVTFRYPDVGEPALSDISVAFGADQFIGVVGRSGSGKTTFSRLIQGLYPVQAGLIRLDGHDIREIDLTHLRQSIGVVPQDAFLFRGSVRENIAVTRSDASFTEIVEAARLAGAEEFIQRLPRGYDTPLVEGAVNLSGGQKQRLSIARALLRRPPILILDEATSALDPDSEAVVQASLRHIAKGRTTIVISHRLTTIRDADTILVFERGRIIDAGPHDDLVERCAIYRQLWMQQTRRLELA